MSLECCRCAINPSRASCSVSLTLPADPPSGSRLEGRHGTNESHTRYEARQAPLGIGGETGDCDSRRFGGGFGDATV